MLESTVPVRSFVRPRSSAPRFGVRRATERFGAVGAHRHPYFELLFFPAGGPAQSIAAKRVEPCAGTIIFVAPMLPHEVVLTASDRCYLLYFDIGYLHPELEGCHTLDAEVVRKAPELTPFLYQGKEEFQIPAGEICRVESMIQQMDQSYEAHSLCADTIVRSQLALLLSEVANRCDHGTGTIPDSCHSMGRATRYVKTAVTYIDDHLDRRITLSEVATAAAITPNYLTSLLRRETGSTFVELLTERRMAKAADLLAYSSLRVSQVADAVGFDDADYFSRRFRQVHGCSPAMFRMDKSRPVALS